MRRALTIVSLLLMTAGLCSAQNALGPGVVELPFIAGQHYDAGTVTVHNTNGGLIIEVELANGWQMAALQTHVGWADNPVPMKSGNPSPGKFDFKYEFDPPQTGKEIFFDFDDDLEGFRWGEPWEPERLRHMAIHADVVILDGNGEVIQEEGAWARGNIEFVGGEWGWWFLYPFTHKAKVHFVDSPVEGLRLVSPSEDVPTDASGGAPYFPGEVGSFYLGEQLLGSTLLEHKVSPLDLLPNSDLDDPRVANMARLLQSLDADADPQPGITITAEVTACVNQALSAVGSIVDWANDAHVDALIYETQSSCPELGLVEVSREVALANLERTINANMYRKNVSMSSPESNSKAKLDIMPAWFPAMKANDDPEAIEYFDENGDPIRIVDEAKPLIISYTQDSYEGTHDVWAAVSRDDGKTWKRKNISRAADRSSFVLDGGLGAPYYGDARKPVMQVKGNKIFIAWTSKFCKGGRPAYSIDTGDDYPFDDPYFVDDIWGVGGPQRSHDYTEDGFPEVGELPYSCLWTARGVIATQSDLDRGLGDFVGDIVWFKPERLTSGRRDAYQVFVGGADGAGFGVVWQEDPEGLRPGKACGPGPGWSGATTNHKTDIWYSYISWSDFAKVDVNFEPGGDPEHNLDEVPGRPKTLVPMSLPVRMTNNAAVNTDNLMVELDADGYPVEDAAGNWIPVMDAEGKHAGTHRYAYMVPGLCVDFYEFTNNQGADKKVCITEDGELLDGDTGASRPNLFLQTYQKPDGTKSAWAIIAYEETKGVGGGAPDHTMGDGPYGDDYVIDEGKNVHYHSFDFTAPDRVHAGLIINHPERDQYGNVLYLQDEYGNPVLDYLGREQLAYLNARRPRFALQGKSAIGPSGTIAAILYKEGPEGQGRPSDIMLQRFVVSGPGNPYSPSNRVCDELMTAPDGSQVCIAGARNMSSMTPTEIWWNANADPDSKGENKKVWKWTQTEDNLMDASTANPYEDARAHRGQLRGDMLVIGYTYTPNWGAFQNGNDRHDFYIRRSFDGGATWTTDPTAAEAITHCQTFTDPETKLKEEECTDVHPSQFEPARNLSQLQNNQSSVIEPRLVATPGTIKVDGAWTGKAEDLQNRDVFYVSFGTSTNPKKDPATGLQDVPVPEDLFFAFTTDRGQHFVMDEWEVNPDSTGNWAGEVKTDFFRLAKGDPEQGEAQLRMTPDGSRFYASWLEELAPQGHSDIHFRRVMDKEFPANNAAP